MREVTALDGVESFTQSPDGSRLLLRWSESYVPPQLAVIGANGEGMKKLTDTRTQAFKAIDWVQPE